MAKARREDTSFLHTHLKSHPFMYKGCKEIVTFCCCLAPLDEAELSPDNMDALSEKAESLSGLSILPDPEVRVAATQRWSEGMGEAVIGTAARCTHMR